jgi:hypothetical protein
MLLVSLLLLPYRSRGSGDKRSREAASSYSSSLT